VVRHGSAKAVFVGSIPTLASNFTNHNINNGLRHFTNLTIG
jgi:hypothetical protein